MPEIEEVTPRAKGFISQLRGSCLRRYTLTLTAGIAASGKEREFCIGTMQKFQQSAISGAAL
jgi:hypothetical protein